MDFLKLLNEKLSEKRCYHSVEVAKTAVMLAQKYGADAQKAETAGLLHDILKEELPAVQLQIIESSGTILTTVERATQKLWHAVAGAVYVQNVLGIGDPDIVNAIRYHTTGRAGMSLLEKVIFVADFTSADRTYADAGMVRARAMESLESAIAEGIAFTAGSLMGKRSLVAPDTIDAYNECIITLQETSEKGKE